MKEKNHSIIENIVLSVSLGVNAMVDKLNSIFNNDKHKYHTFKLSNQDLRKVP